MPFPRLCKRWGSEAREWWGRDKCLWFLPRKKSVAQSGNGAAGRWLAGSRESTSSVTVLMGSILPTRPTVTMDWSSHASQQGRTCFRAPSVCVCVWPRLPHSWTSIRCDRLNSPTPGTHCLRLVLPEFCFWRTLIHYIVFVLVQICRRLSKHKLRYKHEPI